MLKHIPNNISPELMKVLMEMGHGDEIVIADGNFPAASHTERLVRLDGHSIPPLLESILMYFPLDTFVLCPVTYMATPEGDPTPEIWNKYEEILIESGEENIGTVEIDRFAFYDRAKEAYAIISTSESALYANVILKKGVVR
ncbi:RbsD/FucU domain-containing protein [Bacillus sp. FJAT-50079]|uniref:RbsD/FucU family protein n=1 Tax=Bacillus sp. FJAT-50079 TaxID=2833577 RepID=UPI001BC9CD1F|nr:RbsD/FucU domain-containing protein [Bacillus sp. FJAT-50079]MBS4207978.1 fucose isomerase [Bacillus sp. FJAT-50079]